MEDKRPKKISELPEIQESLRGFYTVGYQDTEGGEPESKKVNLGFVQDAADSANEAASNATEKAGEAQQAKQDVLDAQAAIEAAEQERASAETQRQASEQERQTAEQTRLENETSRQTSETQRQEAETTRSEAEEVRVEAEQERQEAETSRKKAERPYSRIDKVAGPLFDVTYPSLDYAYAKDYFENHAPEVTPSGCSVLVKDGILARSYDWKRKTADGKTPCSFAVHTPAAQGHFAVVGMAGGLDALTEDVVEARQFSEAYKILPFCMLDGKNEKDLFAEMNVVPTWHNTRTVPAVEKRESISAMMLVRYILDNFQTVDEAVAYLQDYVEVYMPTNLDEMGFELHFLIADATKSVAIEFVENAIVAIETDKLTNFHLSGVTLNEDGSVYTNADVAEGNLPSSQGIEDYGTGLERFNILNSATDPVKAIKAVVFSKAYTDLVNVWFSEFVGGDITVDTRTENEDFLARIAEYRQKWEDQDNDVWISVHQSIYRLGVAGLDVAIREGSDEHFVPISDHAQAQSDHSLAENDHSTAGDDHTQSTLDRAQAEADHQTATQDHNTAQSDHSTAQTDHTNAVNAANACDAAKAAIEANEQERQEAESSRGTAEAARASAETSRGTAETARATEEAGRINAELSRASSETTRQTNEQTRQTAEQARSAAELARNNAEAARAQQSSEDHEQAALDHSQAETDHSNSETAIEACNEAAQVAEAARKAIQENLAKKVDKVEGKGLSTNDYDNTEKGKVASAVRYNENQALADEQKARARMNIDAAKNMTVILRYASGSITDWEIYIDDTYNAHGGYDASEVWTLAYNPNIHFMVRPEDSYGEGVEIVRRFPSSSGARLINLYAIFVSSASQTVFHIKLTPSVIGSFIDSYAIGDYSKLINKPSINNTVLSGNKAAQDLGLQGLISDLESIRSGATKGNTAVQPSALNNYRTKSQQDEIDNGKQTTLVSGTNIKTINGQSVLGEGNIVIQGEAYIFERGSGENSVILKGLNNNAFEIMQNGDIYVYGLGGYDGTNAHQDGILSLQQIINAMTFKMASNGG